VIIEIFNILGQRIKVLVDEKQKAGFHTIEWDGRNLHNNKVGSGIYFYRMTSDTFTKTRKMILVR